MVAVLHFRIIVEHVHLLFALLLGLHNQCIASHSFLAGPGDEVALLDACFERVGSKLALA